MTPSTGAGSSRQETLEFREGHLHSVACDTEGFDWAPFRSRLLPDGRIHFEAEIRNPEGVRIVWTGEVEGDRLNAQAWRFQFDRSVTVYRVEGMLKQPAPSRRAA